MNCHRLNRGDRFRINGHPFEVRGEETLGITEGLHLMDTCTVLHRKGVSSAP